MPHKCSKIWFLNKTSPKSLPKMGEGFEVLRFFRIRFQDGSRMGPGPPKIIKKTPKKYIFSIMFSGIYALLPAYHFSNFLHRIQCFFAFPTSGCISKLSQQIGRGCGDGTPQASSIMGWGYRAYICPGPLGPGPFLVGRTPHQNAPPPEKKSPN